MLSRHIDTLAIKQQLCKFQKVHFNMELLKGQTWQNKGA
jgi:hypothetical protein